jgi:hypothetical protein
MSSSLERTRFYLRGDNNLNNLVYLGFGLIGFGLVFFLCLLLTDKSKQDDESELE